MTRKPKNDLFEMRGNSNELVVILHGYSFNVNHLRYVKKFVADKMPDADIFTPTLDLKLFSLKDPNEIVNETIKKIDHYWNQRKERIETGTEYIRILFIGHSTGALLARKMFVCACGENYDAPFEVNIEHKQTKDWAFKVERLILLAAMNRGWSISYHMSLQRVFTWWIGNFYGNLVYNLFGLQYLIFTIKKGAPFITQLRIQWLSMLRHAAKKNVGNTLVVQLLGTIDDMVSPEDTVDLVTGSKFVYLDAPYSGHANIIQIDNSEAGVARQRIFELALIASSSDLEKIKVNPSDIEPQPPNPAIKDVVFVIHGIRDDGYWTQRVGRKIKEVGRSYGKYNSIQIETSSYGYFPMLPFLLPTKRNEKVEWLMDQYAENLALYPNADFSFVGHSNGTYLLGKALQRYPACRFKNVVLAGSVIQMTYDWSSLIREGRVQSVLNFVATSDWVVALFPKALQTLKIQDLGSAGFDGFESDLSSGLYQVRYIKGSHSAALVEDNWQCIAEFIIDGQKLKVPRSLVSQNRSKFLGFLSFISPIIWLIIIGLLLTIGIFIYNLSWGGWEIGAVLVYVFIIWSVITRF